MTSHAATPGGTVAGPPPGGLTGSEIENKGLTILGISGRRLAAVLIGWFFVIFDGYDLIVYGTVQSALAREWDLNSATLGTIGSTAFFGMAIGAVFIGRLSDRVGRKAAVIGSVLILSIFTMLCAFAPNPWVFGALRFIAGLGLGGLVPSVNAMTSDLVPRKTMSAWATVMMSGVPIGGSIAAVLALSVVPSSEEWGWRFMFLIALIPLVIGLPIAMKVIPSDKAIKVDHELREGHDEPAGFKDLLVDRYRWISIWFALATFVTLLAWYGLGTWLPRLMETAGYEFGHALMFTLALNLGAVIGSIVTAWAGDRFGPIRSGVVAAGVAGIALLLLLTYPPVSAVYLILILAGVGTHGTQILIIAAVANFYPSNLRGTALGWALGVGRIGAVVAPQLAGLLLAWNLGVNSNFIMFGVAALLSAVALSVLLRLQKSFGSIHKVEIQG
ncbi:MFS transporter [Corynebacterium crudilactis]|uniref:MFS transporter n=1 Tax=Corynebacterium crudilactis TaxID=1652495 RepID=A0A172QWW2_9CORY|nr:aromatic acid/H+ symport family MFS transporter [Corynebacterium crudilactis]ANE05141.1 MFS transporter [Corynebacterium crudilactis]